MDMAQHAYFVGPRTQEVTLRLRRPILEELSKAREVMGLGRANEFTIEALCAEIIESWAAERRIIAVSARADRLCL